MRLGTHGGLIFHTIGQRQGLGLGGRAGYPDAPWYVAAKDLQRNALIAVQGREHPLLVSASFSTEPPTWLAPDQPRALRCGVQVRHRQRAVPCSLEWHAGGGRVVPASPLRGVAPGQYAAFYADEECLGGAVIRAAA